MEYTHLPKCKELNLRAHLQIEFYQFGRRLCLSATDTSLTSEHLRHSLDLVFHTMIFYLGLDDLLNLKNIERTKKELKVMYYSVLKTLDIIS